MNSGGSTLLESMVAIVIVGTVMVTAVSGISSYLRSGKSIDNLNSAAVIGLTETAVLLSGASVPNAIERAIRSGNQDFVVASSGQNLNKTTDLAEVSVKWKEYGADKESRFRLYITRKV